MVETFETFKERGHGIENLLRSDECAFLLVGGPNSEHLRSLEQFLKDLRSRGLDISGVIFNRMAVEAKYLAKEKSTSKRLEELGLSAQDAQVLLNSYRLEARDHKRQMNSIKIFKDESLNSTNTVLLLEEQIIQNLSREKLPFLLENCQKL